jgi:imidazolonepropionase
MEELLQVGLRRLQLWLQQGVTTVEIKSGYGLNLATERKMLLVADELARNSAVDVISTLLAAHAVPWEFSGRGDDYVDYVCQQIIPATADLASAVDVFCEPIAFSVEQSRKVLATGREYGLQVKIHAEQLSFSGGTAMACELNAISADHLEYLDEAGVQALASHGTVATLLPGAYYFLKLSQRPPVELLRQYGVPMAIASDFNPGSSPIGSIFWILNLACLLYGLTAEESLAGMTRHAARALRIDDRVGTIEVGKQADFALWNVTSPESLVCALTENPCRAVYKQGVRVHEATL